MTVERIINVSPTSRSSHVISRLCPGRNRFWPARPSCNAPIFIRRKTVRLPLVHNHPARLNVATSDSLPEVLSPIHGSRPLAHNRLTGIISPSATLREAIRISIHPTIVKNGSPLSKSMSDSRSIRQRSFKKERREPRVAMDVPATIRCMAGTIPMRSYWYAPKIFFGIAPISEVVRPSQ